MKWLKYLISFFTTDELVELVKLQQSLLKIKISIMVKHYESGTFSFVVMKHNGDATGWSKISPFIAKNYYNYRDALEGGITWYYNTYEKGEEEPVEDQKVFNF